MNLTFSDKYSSDYKSGQAFGLLLILSLYNLSIGLPIFFVYILLFMSHGITRSNMLIFIMVLAQILWIVIITLTYKTTPFLILMQQCSTSAILILMMFTPLSARFINGMLKSLAYLFIVDLIFNISLIIFGVDLLGREAQLRPGDFFPRIGGVFGHPFYSANISSVALISGLFLRKRWLIYLSALALLFNGSFRAPLIFLVIVLTFYVVKLKLKMYWIIAFIIAIVAGVVALTAYTASADENFVNGNYLRIVAWTHAIQNIVANPFTGTHSFQNSVYDIMNVDTIINYGIAESMPLQVAQDYGIPAALIGLLILFLIMKRNVFYIYKKNTSYHRITAAILSIVFLVDSFYGTFYGSVLTTFVFASICISLKYDSYPQ
jgi:hypothetical protein